MKRATVIFLFATCEALCSIAFAQSEAESAVRRFALVVAANDGGEGRVMLRYALSDAQAFQTVMEQLGGIAEGDSTLLAQPDAAQLMRTLHDLRAHMQGLRDQGQRVELIFYYSGHSDEQGLRLRGQLVPYRALRAELAALPAEIRIGVLDSCASGAMTRLKGGRQIPAFWGDVSNAVQGHAFLASSSETEAAQESDRIQASFFTYFLVSGLRGAADANRDGRVTLSEAYRFAFDETLARTASTRGGAQHPAYDIELAGTGDFIMTQLVEGSARLSLAPELQGRVFIRGADGRLAAETTKTAGRTLEIALAPGEYRIALEMPDTFASADARLVAYGRTTLDRSQLAMQSPEPTRARGEQGTLPERPKYRVLALSMGLLYPLDANAIEREYPVKNYFSFNWLYGRSGAVDGLQLGIGVNGVDDDLTGVQLTAGLNATGGRPYGLQLAAGANLLEAEGSGAQISAGLNLASGALGGAQVTAGLNIVGADMRGVQIAGVNLAGRVPTGVQIATALNLTHELNGFQLSAGVNATRRVTGVQLASVNLAEQVSGVQLGVINIAGRMRGLQLGVLNYAEDADAQVGVLSVSRRHPISGQLWTSHTALVNVALRLDAAFTYGLVIAGLHPFGSGSGQSVGFGVGSEFVSLERLALGLDATWSFIRYDEGTSDCGCPARLGQLRLSLRFKLTPLLSVFAGPALGVLLQDRRDAGRRVGYGWVATSSRDDKGDEIVLLPGFTLGLQIH